MLHIKKTFFSILLILCFSIFATAQTYLISDGGIQTTCSGDFYDSGGSGSDYVNNENYTITFNSSDAINTHIRVYFWDYIDMTAVMLLRL